MSALAPQPPEIPAVPAAITIPDATGRVWPVDLVAAGYNTLPLGPVPTPQSALIGEHVTASGTFTVAWLAHGPSGNPELEVTLPTGAVVTVLDEDSAQAYIDNG